MLIIFDCDGVLVDSELLAAEAFSIALAQVDIDMSKSECFAAFRGRALEDCFAIIRDKGHRLPADFHGRLKSVEGPLFERELQPVKGVEQVLIELQASRIDFCVASNSRRAKLQSSLEVVGFSRYFGTRWYSAEQVERGKPAPDLFLYAARELGKPVEECLVVEDSIFGIRAALAAGMEVACYGDSGATVAGVQCFDSMSALLGIIATKSAALKG